MDETSLESALARAEAALVQGSSLAGTGFWGAVSAVKRNPELAERYAERIAEIDDRAFRHWALLVVPLWLGTTLMVIGTLVGLGLIWWAYGLDDLAAVIVFYLGVGALLVTTHGLGHLVAGRLAGIGFSSWFVGSIARPQPGVKVDYSSYLRTPARHRAWMHAAGAIVTKLIPFALLGAAIAAVLPSWAIWGLVALGVVSIVTDVLWSTTKSDWKRFRREMGFAQPS